jgi:hypothetical protein
MLQVAVPASSVAVPASSRGRLTPDCGSDEEAKAGGAGGGVGSDEEAEAGGCDDELEADGSDGISSSSSCRAEAFAGTKAEAGGSGGNGDHP